MKVHFLGAGFLVAFLKHNMENWFKHDANAHADAKLMQLLMHSKTYYANYFLTLEWLFNMSDATASTKELNGLAYFLHENKEDTEAFVSFCIELDLFVKEDNHFYSPRLKDQKSKQNEKSAAAREKAEKRWNKKNATAMLQHSHSNAEEKRIEENRIEENTKDTVELKLNDEAQNLFDFYKKCSGKGKVIMNTTRKKSLNARLTEFTYEEIRKAWAMMAGDEYLRGKSDRNNKDYFTLDYALRSNNIEKYLDEFETKISPSLT